MFIKVLRFLFLLLICFESSGQAFIDLAAELGVQGSYTGGPFSGGMSFADFNGDGQDDLSFATNTGEPMKFYLGSHGSFTEVFLNISNNKRIRQILWVDYDNDGDKDLFTTSLFEGNDLYRNNGGLEFENVNFQSGLINLFNPTFSYGASFGDIDNDGWLDFYIVNRSNQGNQFFRNNGDGTFSDITVSLGLGQQEKGEFCSTFFDINNDNLQEIYLANDKCIGGGNSLFKNLGGLAFENISETSNTDICMSAMCVTVGDYNNDGLSDIYVTNSPPGSFFADGAQYGNKLLRNEGDETFSEVSNALGVDFSFIWTWGSDFLDFDNDGDLDLYVAGGNPVVGYAPNSLFRNDEGFTFTSLEPEESMLNDTVQSFSCATGDFDNDGYLDLAVSNYQPYQHNIWHNQGDGSEWAKFRLEGTVSNKDGIGSRVEMYSELGFQMRTLQCGEGYLSQNSNTLHFGLSDQNAIDSVVVKWPSGIVNTVYLLESGRTYKILEHEPGSLANCLPTVDFTHSMNGGYLSLDVLDWDQNSNASWDFGDGEIAEGLSTSHSFLESGTYQVCLTMTSECGTSSYCEFIEIDIESCTHETSFEFTLSSDTLYVNDTSTGEPLDWQWDFGQGTFSDSSSAMVVYGESGFYDVCLTTTNVCSQDSFCIEVVINESECAPVSGILVEQFGASITGTGTAINADSVYWLLNNEVLTNSGLELQLDFEFPGVYELCFVAENTCSSDTSCVSVEVLETDCAPDALFDLSQDGNTINLNNLSSNADSLVWNLGDGAEIVDVESLEYVFVDPGTYEVCLTVFNQCSSDTSCETIEVLSTSISEPDVQESISLFPNPAGEEMFLSWRVDPHAVVIISSQLGAILSQSNNLFVLEPIARINLIDFPNGVYTLTLKASDQVSRRQFVVIH